MPARTWALMRNTVQRYNFYLNSQGFKLKNFRKTLQCGKKLPILKRKIIKKGALTMKVLDKEENVIMEMNHQYITHARMGTARISKGEKWPRKPYKVVSRKEFDAGSRSLA